MYIPVTKRSDASTLDVIQRVKQALPNMKAAALGDVEIRLEFDQSKFVANAIRNLITEGALGAILTGVMVLLFLRDWRSSLIVIATIPFALLSAVLWLWAAGQTINSIALAVGVLVDEATVEMKLFIQFLMKRGKRDVTSHSRDGGMQEDSNSSFARYALRALGIRSAVFHGRCWTPAIRSAFTRRGLAMVSSYVLSTTLVPVLATWMMKETGQKEKKKRLWRERYAKLLRGAVRFRWDAGNVPGREVARPKRQAIPSASPDRDRQ